MKKKPKSKGIIITLILLIIICLICGTLGLLESKKTITSNKPSKEKDFKVTYRYYLDGEEVDEMIEQEFTELNNPDFEGAVEEIPNYAFEKYTCTNDVIGEFDEEKWEFTPNLTANSTCRLYFIKTMHKVTFKASNGKLPSGNPEEEIIVALEKEGKINIIGNDGYKYDRVDCTNGVLANYDENTKDLTVSNVKKDSTCTVSFKISDFTAEVTASNGSVTEPKKSSNYGGTVEFDVTPSENYKFGDLKCTNGQNGNYNEATGKLTITGLTNDTVCTIEFKPIRYQVTLVVKNGTILSTSQNPQSVAEGRTASFGISANDGYALTGAEASCVNPNGAKIEASGGIVSVYNVTSDLTCTVTLKATSN